MKVTLIYKGLKGLALQHSRSRKQYRLNSVSSISLEMRLTRSFNVLAIGKT